jgi:hypothetical protein
MILNILIVVTLTSSTIAILDVLLSDLQKSRLGDWLIKSWVWLDDAALTAAHIPTNISNRFAAWMVSQIPIIMDPGGHLWYQPRTGSGVGFRQFGGGVLYVIVSVAGLYAMARLHLWLVSLFSAPDLISWYILILIGYILLAIPSLIVLMLLLLAFGIGISEIVIHTIYFCLKAGEYSVRRITEYPKGPIIGVAIVLTAILAFLKALS